MITRTIKMTQVEYKVYNKITEDVQTLVADLYGTYADEDAIIKALADRILDYEIVLKANVTDEITQKFGMTIDQFVATATKLAN